MFLVTHCKREVKQPSASVPGRISDTRCTAGPCCGRPSDSGVIPSVVIPSAVSSAGLKPSLSFGRPSHFSFKTAVEVEIEGHNLILLGRMAEDVVARMQEIDGLADIKASTEGGHPELQVRLDRDRLASYDLNVAGVAERVRSKVQGTIAIDITRSDRTIDIRLRGKKREEKGTLFFSPTPSPARGQMGPSRPSDPRPPLEGAELTVDNHRWHRQ